MTDKAQERTTTPREEMGLQRLPFDVKSIDQKVAQKVSTEMECDKQQQTGNITEMVVRKTTLQN